LVYQPVISIIGSSSSVKEGRMPPCKEIKRYLSGAEQRFECELLALEGGFGMLKYVIQRRWQVAGLTLEPGTVTYAFYWTGRPYNLYWWLDENGATLGHYFNVADSVSLSAQAFVWRDLVVDVLVLPSGQVRVLDEDELPDALDEDLRAYIQAAKRRVLREYRAIIETAALAAKKCLLGARRESC
jgi:predicted RNA-binding protein associated with RNAse of E/G family